MENNEDLRSYYASQSRREREHNHGKSLRWWATALLAYPAVELLIAFTYGLVTGKAYLHELFLLSAPAVALAWSIFLLRARDPKRTYMALGPVGLYVAASLVRGQTVSLPVICVIVGGACLVVLARSQASLRRA